MRTLAKVWVLLVAAVTRTIATVSGAEVNQARRSPVSVDEFGIRVITNDLHASPESIVRAIRSAMSTAGPLAGVKLSMPIGVGACPPLRVWRQRRSLPTRWSSRKRSAAASNGE